MTTYRSLNHTKWHCQYHVVFIGLDPISWTLSERRIRCPRWQTQRSRDGHVVGSPKSSGRALCGWCSMRDGQSVRSRGSST